MWRGEWWRKKPVWILAALITYLAIACLAYWPVQPLSQTQVVGCACSDRVQEVWFLAWMFHSLSHAVNPFFTTSVNYPYGINLVNNTSMPLLGLIGSPVTAIFGPIATFNLLTRLAFFASATSMMFVLLRYTKWFPAAFLGGLLYGFSPYVVDQALGHVFAAFVPIPPLIVLIVDELLRRQKKSARRYGVILGLLLAAQFFISIEILVTTLMCCVVGIACAAAISHSQVREHLAHALQGAKWAVGTLAVIIAYPAYCYFLGPWHVTRPQHTVAELSPYQADLFGTIIPTISQLFAPAHLAAIGTTYVGNDIAENDSYLGIPLILVLLVLLFWNRRDRFIQVLTCVAVVAFVLSLGSPLVVGGHATAIALPFAIVRKLPVISNLIAARFALYVDLVGAFVFAIGLDRWRRGVGSPDKPRHARARSRGSWTGALRSRAAVTGVVALIGVGVLVPLVPQMPFVSKPADIPAYFTTSAVDAIPAQSVVVTYPYDIGGVNYGMLWQAISGFSFRLVGGEAAKPYPTAPGSNLADPVPPVYLQHLFRAGYWGLLHLAPKLVPKREAQVRYFLTHWHVGTIVFDPIGVHPAFVIHYLTVVLGRPPVKVGGVDVWYHADQQARRVAVG